MSQLEDSCVLQESQESFTLIRMSLAISNIYWIQIQSLQNTLFTNLQ